MLFILYLCPLFLLISDFLLQFRYFSLYFFAPTNYIFIVFIELDLWKWHFIFFQTTRACVRNWTGLWQISAMFLVSFYIHRSYLRHNLFYKHFWIWFFCMVHQLFHWRVWVLKQTNQRLLWFGQIRLRFRIVLRFPYLASGRVCCIIVSSSSLWSIFQPFTLIGILLFGGSGLRFLIVVDHRNQIFWRTLSQSTYWSVLHQSFPLFYPLWKFFSWRLQKVYQILVTVLVWNLRFEAVVDFSWFLLGF